MPRHVAADFQSEFSKLAAAPAKYRGDWKPLQGRQNGWRLRLGAWRAVCDVRQRELLILVLEIGSRGDIYK
jgi:mRNA interferase RelE/StbE